MALVKVECIQEMEPRWLKRYLRFLRSARPGSDCRPCQMEANDLGADESLQRALVNWRSSREDRDNWRREMEGVH